jgi:hypothetical protein
MSLGLDAAQESRVGKSRGEKSIIFESNGSISFLNRPDPNN